MSLVKRPNVALSSYGFCYFTRLLVARKSERAIFDLPAPTSQPAPSACVRACGRDFANPYIPVIKSHIIHAASLSRAQSRTGKRVHGRVVSGASN